MDFGLSNFSKLLKRAKGTDCAAVETMLREAIASGSRNQLEAIVSTDFSYTVQASNTLVTISRADWLEEILKDSASNKYSIVEFSVNDLGGMALIVVIADIGTSSDQGEIVLFTDLWAMGESGWSIISRVSSTNK